MWLILISLDSNYNSACAYDAIYILNFLLNNSLNCAEKYQNSKLWILLQLGLLHLNKYEIRMLVWK